MKTLLSKTLGVIILTLLFLTPRITNAQMTAAAYTYARSTGGSYSSISGSGTSITYNDVFGFGSDFDEGVASVPIGFTFYFCGTPYTSMVASTNGWVSLAGYSADPLLTNTSANIPGAGFLMCNWDDLIGTNTGYGSYYSTTGSSPNRVFTIEWASWNNYASTGNGKKSNFQIKLFEGTNVIQYCYGTPAGAITTASSSIGIANSTTDYKSIATLTATTASSSTFTTTLAGWSAANSILTWTPPCSAAPTAGTATSTVTFGCLPSYSSTLSLTGATTTNVAYQWQSSPTGTTWTDVSGATNSTYVASVSAAIQYRCNLRCIYSVSSANSTARSLTAPGPIVTVTPNVSSVCSGGSQTLTASGATSYTWSPSTNLSATVGASVSSTPTASRTYTVTGTTSGCTNTAVAVVNLSGGTPGTITGTASACPGASSTLSNSTTGGTWSSSNTSIATVDATTGVVTGIIGAGGTSATITYNTGCGSPATQTFNVLSAPTVSLNLPTASYCYGHAIPLVASGTATSYTWAPSTNLSATTGAVVTATPSASRTYTVTGIGASCNTTATSVITVSAATDTFNLSPIASPATTCSGGSSTLTPVPSAFAYSSVSAITYSLVTQTSPTTLTFPDTDEDTLSVNLPFTFNYYGTNYSSINVCTNGYISFVGASSNYSVVTLPDASAAPAMVALFWSDLDLAATTPNGTVTTSVEGTAPNRKFVIYYKGAYDFFGTINGYSGQIVLYETSNTIDLIVTSTTSNTHVCGIQNSAASVALCPAGRNNATYQVVTPEAWRFTSIPTLSYVWSPATFLSSAVATSPVASSVTSSTTYTVVGVNASNNCVSSNTVAVNVGTIVGTISASTGVCLGSSTTITFTGPGSGTGTYTINGASSTGFSFDASGHYTITVSPTTTAVYALTSVVTGSCSRTVTGQTATITVNGSYPTVGTNSPCSGGTLSLTSTSSAGTYSWTGPNGFTSTAQNPSISSVTTAAAGTYTFSTTSTAGSCTYTAMEFVVVDQTPSVTVTASPTTICAGGTSNLTDVVTAPTTLTVNAIPYTTYTTSGTTVTASDDGRPSVTLPFTFTFYGTAYTSCRISSNGFINFSGNPGTAYTPVALPSSGAPLAMIALFWQDLNPLSGGTITYTTIGSTPNRKFIVSYNSVVANSGAGTSTGQIILYETSNIIDLMISGTNLAATNNVVTGIQNAAGTAMLTPPAKNYTTFSLNGPGEGWRFATPSYTYSWTPSTTLSGTTISNPVSTGLTSTQIYTVTTIDVNSSCAAGNVSTATVTVNPLPTAYSITGGGAYCAVPGTGVHIGLSNSETGVNYRAYKAGSPVGSIVAGATGSALDFGLFTDTTGAYTVVATNATTGCVKNMTGSFHISINANPTAYTLTGGNGCTSTGVTIGLSNSQTGVTYQIFNGGTGGATRSGSTGSSLTYGSITAAGIYTIIGTGTGSCTTTMTGSSVINTSPTAYSVTGGTGGCSGGGIAVGLANSQSGVSYQLYLGASTSGSPVSGTASAITFGTQSTPGTYTVTGTASGCSTAMTGSATVNTPSSVSLGGNPSVCQPISSATISYSSPGGSPTIYAISWGSAALTDGFTNVGAGTLTGGTITLSIPNTSVHGVYSGDITVSNGVCTSTTYPFTLTVYAYPTASITSAVAPCMGYGTNIVFTGTDAANINYTIDGGSPVTATLTGGTYSLSTGALTAAHTYVLVNALNPACTTTLGTSATVTPNPMQWTGATSADWNNAANWSCGFVPGTSDDATIPSGTPNAPAIAASASGSTRSLTIASGVNVTVGNSGTLTVAGNLTNSGLVSGSGILTMNSGSAQTVSGFGAVNNFNVNNAAGVTVATGARLTVKSVLSVTTGSLATSDSVVLYSDTNGSARVATLPSGTSITGNVKVNQFFTGGRRAYRFWAHPFSNYIGLSQLENYVDVAGPGGSLNGFTTTGSNQPSAYRYNPYVGNSTLAGDPGWRPFTSAYTTEDTNRLHQYQGIRVYYRGAKGEGLGFGPYLVISSTTASQWGALNQGNQNIPLSRGATTAQDYNMVGNPYASPVDIGTVIFNAASSGRVNGGYFYIWNPFVNTAGAFQAVPYSTGGGSPVAIPYYIQANDAFQIRAMHDGDQLNFTESNKGASISNIYSLMKSRPDFVSLYVYDANYHPYDMLYVKFDADATNDEDAKYDGGKPSGNDFNFYSLSADNHKLMVDARPYKAESIIPLGVRSSYAQDYIIRAENISVPEGGKVYLHDKLLKQYILLQQGTEYRFSVTKEDASQGENRFELSMAPAEVKESPLSKGLNVAMRPNPATDEVNITFTQSRSENVSIRVLDLSGACVYSQALGNLQNSTVKIPLNNIASGIYMVELTSGDQKVVQRLVKE